MKKKYFLIGFFVIMLLIIPLSVFLLKQKTPPPTKAAQATKLSFDIPSTPINVGDTFTLGIVLDPANTNLVSFVKLVITYDPTILQRVELKKNDSLFQILLEGPTYDKCPTPNLCMMSISMAIDPKSGTPIQGGPTTIGSVSFIAKANTPASGPTSVAFDTGTTQILSLASTDAPSENVLLPSGATPAQITIGGGTSTTPSPTTSPGTTTLPTPTGTEGSGGGTTGGIITITPSAGPVCSSFTADTTSGNSPLTVNFSISGNENNGTGTINKVSLNYGDGATVDLTNGGGIGTATISTSSAHIYQIDGTYTATATLTDSNNAISNPTTCSQTIIVGQINPTPTIAPAQPTPTPVAKLMNTGPGEIIVGTGLAGVGVSILGGILLFGL